MKNDLLSLSELAGLWGKKHTALQKGVQRKTFRKVVFLDKEQAEKMGLQWSNRSAPTRRGRPYISIHDPAIPDHVRKKHYEKITRGSSGDPPSLTGAESSPPARAEGTTQILHISTPLEDSRPGRDATESVPAVGTGTTSSNPPQKKDRRLPEPEIPGLPNGASLKFRGEEEGPLPGTSFDMMAYRELPGHARKQVDKYLPLVLRTEGMSRAETEKELSQWNSENPEFAMSARSLRYARKRYRERGVAGLASKRGGRAGQTIVRDEWFEYFQSLYLKEGAPSAYSCWLMTRGKFAEEDDFPVYQTFIYQLRRRMPEDAIYMARHGEAAWNRKFGMYIERDYSNIRCGEVWVSDHAQIDVAVADLDGKPFFPWVTAWRDIKSGKWLGWLLHREPSNADHVFQSFYYACRDFGLPRHIYIDNGKDYRAKDFAGGRTKAGTLVVNEASARSICAVLRIDVHFALPYNAQAKNIERDFLTIKGHFSKHMPGYRGGHTKERPEALAAEIRKGKIISSGEFAALLSLHLFHNQNRAPSQGKNLRGLCPDELYEREAENGFVDPAALSILCMRISGSRAVGRNGVKDSRSKLTYFAEWMLGQKGRKVYLRRDPSDMETAWVFDAGSDEYLGRGYRVEGVPAIVVGDEERATLGAAMADKRTARRTAKAYASDVREIPPLEKVANMAMGNALLSGYAPGGGGERGPEVKFPEAEAVREKERSSAVDGKADYSAVAPPRREKPLKIYQSKADREREELERQLLEEEAQNEST